VVEIRSIVTTINVVDAVLPDCEVYSIIIATRGRSCVISNHLLLNASLVVVQIPCSFRTQTNEGAFRVGLQTFQQ
jgi:hypothetical protein